MSAFCPAHLACFKQNLFEGTDDVPADARVVPEKALRLDKKALAQELQGLGSCDSQTLPLGVFLYRCICVEQPLQR